MHEDIRCLDYVLDTNLLIYGTGTGQVQTKNFVDHLSYYDTELPTHLQMVMTWMVNTATKTSMTLWEAKMSTQPLLKWLSARHRTTITD